MTTLQYHHIKVNGRLLNVTSISTKTVASGSMENPEHQNNLDQPKQQYFCTRSHVFYR